LENGKDFYSLFLAMGLDPIAGPASPTPLCLT
jgi:hypothetical protein